jgi:hypothetical protein
VPKAWQVLTDRHYLLPVALRDRHRLLATPCTVILFDLVRAPQPCFSDPLQRARHQAILGLDGVELAARTLGIVARPLALERPLPLQPPGSLPRSRPDRPPGPPLGDSHFSLQSHFEWRPR